jgi:hypothetical protein
MYNHAIQQPSTSVSAAARKRPLVPKLKLRSRTPVYINKDPKYGMYDRALIII